jgi:hypothetical protein
VVRMSFVVVVTKLWWPNELVALFVGMTDVGGCPTAHECASNVICCSTKNKVVVVQWAGGCSLCWDDVTCVGSCPKAHEYGPIAIVVVTKLQVVNPKDC